MNVTPASYTGVLLTERFAFGRIPNPPMSAARKTWQDAKARVRNPKDWESKLRFKDNFGPNLDELDSLGDDLVSKLRSIQGLMQKLETTLDAAQSAMNHYRAGVSEGSDRRPDPWKDDRVILLTGLGEAWDQLEKDYMARVRERVNDLHQRHMDARAKLKGVLGTGD